MKKEHFLTVIDSVVIISGVIILSACASVAAVGQTGGLEAQVNTAVAATLIQYMVETQVAATSVALALPPAGQAQATQPPPPTPTPVSTEPAPPTVAPTVAAPQPTAPPPPSPTAPPPPPPSGPTITADQNTNCRVGPSTGYAVKTYFVEGSASTVEGKDAGMDWWYIVSPDDTSENCWVWEGSTTVQGDTSSVPVVAAPSGTEPKPYSTYYAWNVYKPYNAYGCTNYSSYCCGKAACCGKVVVCKPNQNYCNPYPWWTCNPNVNCTCKPVYQNPCRKGGCPPITEVNYKNYCKKYPQCCNDED
jgi:hypothetical protein